MRLRANLIGSSTRKIGVFVCSICFVFASALSAQDRDAYGGPPTQDRDAYGGAPSAQNPDSYGGVPETLTLPAGTSIVGQLSQYLSSHQNHPGDGFSMTLSQPLIVNGWVLKISSPPAIDACCRLCALCHEV